VVSTERCARSPGWVAADLNYNLPFRDASFDLVLMLEVIEHLADIPHALHEIARVLKPDGAAILSTPNRLNLSSRLHHLLTGFYKGRRAPLSYRDRVEDRHNWHVMGLNDFHRMSYGAGLRMDRLGRSRRKARAFVLVPLLYVPIALASWWLYVRGVHDAHQCEIYRDLLQREPADGREHRHGDRTRVIEACMTQLRRTSGDQFDGLHLRLLRALASTPTGQSEGNAFQQIAMDGSRPWPVRNFAWHAYAQSSARKDSVLMEAAREEQEPNVRRPIIATMRTSQSRKRTGRKFLRHAARRFPESRFTVAWVRRA
jgi:SAM-dependent methyltransferase